MKNVLFYIFIMLLIVANCTSRRGKTYSSCNLQRLDTTIFKKSFLQEVHRYIKKENKFESFLICSVGFYKKDPKKEQKYKLDPRVRKIFNEVYVIRGANIPSVGEDGVALSRNYPSLYFILDKKRIFLCSSIDALCDQKRLKGKYNQIVKEKRIYRPDYYFVVFDEFDSTITINSDELYLTHNFSSIVSEPIFIDTTFVAPTVKSKR